MSDVTRRHFLAIAAGAGATLAWCTPAAARSHTRWRERRDLFPEGVASGDPQADSVMLWTRRPFNGIERATLTLEVAEDEGFRRVVSTTSVPVLAAADWTCRALAAGLKPAQVYWYRFTDAQGNGSRIGRTITAPADDDPRAVRFAFVSCQTVNEGKLNAYRRMIWEDERAAPDKRLGFVLHLGDFIYEVVQYPDEVKTRYDRTIYDIGRVPNARKVRDFHVPTDLEGYRFVYRAHLADPDLQDARARFPFVCIWDNHEFSWLGWQSHVKYDGKVEPAQPIKVAANQAWFEYLPSRAAKASGPSLGTFDGPNVSVAPITELDDDGLGQEPNNLAAINSLTAYRAFRYGRNVEMFVTDLFSYRTADPTGDPRADAFSSGDFADFYPEEAIAILDGGRAYDGGKPPEAIAFDGKQVANFRKDAAPVTMLGAKQKAWFKDALTRSTAKWKLWAASNGPLDWRADPQNLPPGFARPWPGAGYAGFGGGDLSSAHIERAEIYDLVRDTGMTGFATISGDRHSFWAGYAAKPLAAGPFEPVGVSFITGSISAPGLVEAVEHALKKHPLRPLYLVDRPGQDKPDATINMTMRHGVRAALEYANSGDIAKARALRNPELSPHLEFVDMGGHGYSVVTVGSDAIETEFVCIPRPIARAATPDGGPLRYRVTHRAALWAKGERPKLEQRVLEGDPKMSI